MTFVSAVLFSWIRKTRSLFAALCSLPFQSRDEKPAGEGLIYRLKYWPNLPQASRTAEVLRVLSVMSHRPVNRRWILAHTRLATDRIDTLLKDLVGRGAVEVIDPSRFDGECDYTRPVVAASERAVTGDAFKASSLSIRLPSSVTTSNNQSPHSMRSPAAGIWPDTDINRPATVL